MGKQFIASNSFLDLCDILYNCRQKKMHSFYEIGILAFSFSERLGYHAKQVKQKKGCVKASQNKQYRSGVKYFIFDIKTLILHCLW